MYIKKVYSLFENVDYFLVIFCSISYFSCGRKNLRGVAKIISYCTLFTQNSSRECLKTFLMGRKLGTIFGTFLACNNLAKIENTEKYFYGPGDHPHGHLSFKYYRQRPNPR